MGGDLIELAPLAIAAPMLAAALLVLPWRLRRTRIDLFAILAAGAVTIFLGALALEAFGAEVPLVEHLGGWEPREGGTVLGISMAVDPLGAALALLAAVLVTVALLFTWRFFDAPGKTFHALMLVFLAGLAGFALTGDLFNMFVSFELMSVSAYALTALRVEKPAPLQGALSFAVTSSVGAIMILFGIALLYGRTGALNMAQVGETLASQAPDALVVVAFALIVGGFLVKAAAVPFHFWLADAYAVAPTPAVIVFTGVMSDLGIYAIARLYWTVFEGALAPYEDEIRAILIAFAILTALVGAVMCLVQHNLRRLLAFATISQIGAALAAIALLTPAGVAAAALLVPVDGLLRAGLFVCLGILLHRCGSSDELHLQGRGVEVPRVMGFLFIAGAVGLAALPPIGAFAGKALLEEAAVEVGYGWIIAPVLLATVITAAALLRAAGRIFRGWGASREASGLWEPPEVEGAAGYTPPVMLAVAGALIVAGLVLGALPGAIETVDHAAASFTDRATYAAAVLDQPLPPAAHAEGLHIGALEWVLGLAGVALAVGLAAYVLRPSTREPFRYRIDAANPLERWLVRLRRLHSGQIGDYVSWLVVGFALLSGSLVLAI